MLRDEEREDWRISLEDMMGEAERDGRRCWLDCRGPDRPEQPGPGQASPEPDEVPVWMGISTQVPARPALWSRVFLEPQGFARAPVSPMEAWKFLVTGRKKNLPGA